jgi:hypothetical protein
VEYYFDFRNDGILGQYFWNGKRDTIDYCNLVITMVELVLYFDEESDKMTNVNLILTLTSIAETIVRLPTKSKGFGIISKCQLAPGIYLAETLTEGLMVAV